MARHQHDREDLLREATALVERAELVVPGFADPVVFGFRRDSTASIYFGTNRIYRFNTKGQLHRVDGHGLIVEADREKAETKRLETKLCCMDSDG